MAFVVEDGTGLSTANSYVSLAEWTTYNTDRNNTEALAYSDAAVQGALIYATEYLDQQYDWYSLAQSTTQALGWPRAAFYIRDNKYIAGDSVPQPIKNATIELAIAHLSNALNSSDSENVVSERYGDASITYKGSSKTYSYTAVNLRDYGCLGYSSSNTLYRA